MASPWSGCMGLCGCLVMVGAYAGASPVRYRVHVPERRGSPHVRPAGSLTDVLMAAESRGQPRRFDGRGAPLPWRRTPAESWTPAHGGLIRSNRRRRLSAEQILVLGLVHVASCAVIYTGVGISARQVLRTRPTAARAVTRFSAAPMIVIGVVLLVEQQVA